jgi:hypothetical protein
MPRARITTFLSQLQSTWTGPVHPLGVVEDEGAVSLEDRPPKPLNQDTFPQEQASQTSRTSSAINAATRAITLGTVPRGHPREPPPQT